MHKTQQENTDGTTQNTKVKNVFKKALHTKIIPQKSKTVQNTEVGDKHQIPHD